MSIIIICKNCNCGQEQGKRERERVAAPPPCVSVRLIRGGFVNEVLYKSNAVIASSQSELFYNYSL